MEEHDTLFGERKIWQRRGFAPWLSYYGTGKPTASAEDRHIGNERVMQRLG